MASPSIYMPPPANNHFYGAQVTVTFNAQGVTDVTDSNGNRSLGQSEPNHLTLEVRDGDDKVVRTINITVER